MNYTTMSSILNRHLIQKIFHMTEPKYWQQSKEFLSKADPSLEELLLKHEDYIISSRGEALETLENHMKTCENHIKSYDFC